ncbi:histone H4-K16 acetylation [Mactra antiquata]
MHAMDFYTSTCRCVMQANPENAATLAELRRLLPCLRQALGCYVCFNLLKDPMGPDHNVCRHSVCMNCLGGKMKLKPACSWCKDYWDFVPNPLMKVLVTCYKKLCVYIYNSPLGQVIRNENVNGEINHLLKTICEGMNFDDDYSVEQPCVSPTGKQQSVSNISSINKPSCSTETASTSGLNTTSGIETTNIDSVQTEDGSKCDSQESSVLSDTTVTEDHVTIQKVRNRKVVKRSSKIQNKPKCSDHCYGNSHIWSKKPKSKRPGFRKQSPHNKKTLIKNHKLRSSLSPMKKTKEQKSKVKKFNTRLSKQEQPSELERIDNSEPPLKKVKEELPPPELKPISRCKCGNSGNFNQLTCIGQRCPCYSMKLPCIGCKCRGCRNPKKGPDYQGMGTIGNSAVLRSGTRNTSDFMCVTF